MIDIMIAEKIFGLDVLRSLKGKSTWHKKPKPVRKYLIEIPEELIIDHHDTKLCMDTMYVNECSMLMTINWTIKYYRHHEE